jgi:hypothetical protein
MSALEGSRDHPLNSHPAHDYLILLGDTIDSRGIKLKRVGYAMSRWSL